MYLVNITPDFFFCLATLLRIDKERGSLAIGTIADLVLIDDQVNVKATYQSSKLVYSAIV